MGKARHRKGRRNSVKKVPARMLSRYRLFRWLATHPKLSGSGGLGVAALGAGFELSAASRLAALCYLAALVIWALVIYFSPWWERKRRRCVALIIALGLGLFLFWWVYLPAPAVLPP